jgi:hypothetical protein
MAQAASRPLIAEGLFRARVNPRGICGEQSGIHIFLRILRAFPVNITPPRFSTLKYRLGGEQ